MKKIREMLEGFASRFSSEKGQTMIEYALVVVLIAIVLAFLFMSAGVREGISGAGSRVASALGTANN